MKKRLILVTVFVLIGLLAGFKLVLQYGRKSSGKIRISGNIEVTDAEVSFKIPGRVQARMVDEGQTVQRGDIVARLDDAELTQEVALRRAEAEAARAVRAEFEAGSRKQEIAQTQAAAAQAKARLDEMLAGSRPQELAAAEAAWRAARAETERAKQDAERYEGLFKKEIVSAQQREAARTSYETALERQRQAEEQLKLVREGPRQEEIEQARAQWMQAEERFRLVKEGPRREQIEQTRARAEQAKQALAVAETRLGYATLVSPLAGVVLSKNTEPGEYVAAGTPIVTVGDLEHPWVRVFIDETDLGRVKVGQSARVTTDTFPGKSYEGRVSFIASQAEFTPRSVQTEKERVKLVYRVKVEIANQKMELKPGMPADVEISLVEK
ncbi:MAG: HlyD family secretion protein [Terriglobia bacterium]